MEGFARLGAQPLGRDSGQQDSLPDESPAHARRQLSVAEGSLAQSPRRRHLPGALSKWNAARARPRRGVLLCPLRTGTCADVERASREFLPGPHGDLAVTKQGSGVRDQKSLLIEVRAIPFLRIETQSPRVAFTGP